MTAAKFRSVFQRLNRIKFRLIVTLLLCIFTAVLFSYIFTARNTLIVSDGSSSTHVGYTGDTRGALIAAGVDPDEVENYTLSPDGTPELIVSQSHTVSVVYDDGRAATLFCQGTTVMDVMEQLNIDAAVNAVTDYSLEDELFDGMTMHVSVGEGSYAYGRSVTPYETVYIDSPSLPSGEEQVLQAGADGVDFLTYFEVYRGGELASSEIVQSKHLSDPVKEIIVRGTLLPEQINSLSRLSGSGSERSSFAAGSAVAASDVPAVIADNGSQITTASGDVLSYTRAISVSATAYTTELDPTPNRTASGTVARVGAIAVDSSVIPLGTKLYIVASDGTWLYGYASAEDRGGGIKGNRVDLFFDTQRECINFGSRSATVYVLG